MTESPDTTSPTIPRMRVFVSHRSIDAAWAKLLAAELRRRGIHAWLDLWDMPPGVPLSDAMQEGIASSNAMLLVLTPSAIEAVRAGTGGVAFEVHIGEERRFRDGSFRIIGLLREECDPPEKLRNRIGRWLDFRKDEELEQRIDELVGWLREEPQGPPVAQPDNSPEEGLTYELMKMKRKLPWGSRSFTWGELIELYRRRGTEQLLPPDVPVVLESLRSLKWLPWGLLQQIPRRHLVHSIRDHLRHSEPTGLYEELQDLMVRLLYDEPLDEEAVSILSEVVNSGGRQSTANAAFALTAAPPGDWTLPIARKLLEGEDGLGRFYAVELMKKHAGEAESSLVDRIRSDDAQPLIARFAAGELLGPYLEQKQSRQSERESSRSVNWRGLLEAVWWNRRSEYRPLVLDAYACADGGYSSGFDELATMLWVLGKPEDCDSIYERFPVDYRDSLHRDRRRWCPRVAQALGLLGARELLVQIWRREGMLHWSRRDGDRDIVDLVGWWIAALATIDEIPVLQEMLAGEHSMPREAAFAALRRLLGDEGPSLSEYARVISSGSAKRIVARSCTVRDLPELRAALDGHHPMKDFFAECLGFATPEHELDWILDEIGQPLDPSKSPMHRSLTIFDQRQYRPLDYPESYFGEGPRAFNLRYEASYSMINFYPPDTHYFLLDPRAYY